jgi:4-amino-4-deoxy-L-arabinose transferase-like glycosyltransferase
MNFQQIKNYKVPIWLAITAITLTAYLPFWFHLLDIREIQLKNNQPFYDTLPVYGSDSGGYINLANNILKNHVFSSSSEAPFLPNTHRTPGYPFLLAFFKSIFGTYTYFPLVQLLFTIGTAVLIFLIGEKLYGKALGIAAAILFVLNPTVIVCTLMIVSDLPFVFLLLLFIYLMFFNKNSVSYPNALGAGLTLGLSVLVRPISMYTPIFLLPLFIYLNWKTVEKKRLFMCAGIIMLAFFVSIFPWMIRNKTETDVFGVSSVKDFNFFHYNVPEYISFKTNTTPDSIRKKMYEEWAASAIEPRDSTSLRNTSQLQSISYRYIKPTITNYSVWHAVKIIPFFFTSGIKHFFYQYNDILHYEVYRVDGSNITNLLMKGQFADILRVFGRGMLVFSEQLFWAVVFVLMFIPLFLEKDRKRLYALTFLCLVFYLALPTAPVVEPRLRLPATPFMFLLAAWGFLILKNIVVSKIKGTKK